MRVGHSWGRGCGLGRGRVAATVLSSLSVCLSLFPSLWPVSRLKGGWMQWAGQVERVPGPALCVPESRRGVCTRARDMGL